MASLVDSVLSTMRFPILRMNRSSVGASCNLAEISSQLGHPLDVTVARFDGIGDWILCLPLINALIESPSIRSVRLVAPASHRSLLDHDGVSFIPYRAGTILQPPWPGGLLGKLRAVSFATGNRAYRMGMKAEPCDVVILPRWDTDLGQNARAWAAGTRAILIGFDPRDNSSITHREAKEQAILTKPVADSDSSAHEIVHTRRLLGAVGLPSSVEYGYGRQFFGLADKLERKGTSSPFVIIHASSVEPKRRWPAAYWAELIALLVESEGARIGLIGAKSEADELEQLRAGHEISVENFAGKPLGELPQTLDGCSAFIGNDSGPMHVASSIDIPVVAISPHPRDGSSEHRNSPSRFGPWCSRSEVLQPAHGLAPCSTACTAKVPHCITQISPNEVLEAYRRVTRSALEI